jgi:hypothetical protein
MRIKKKKSYFFPSLPHNFIFFNNLSTCIQSVKNLERQNVRCQKNALTLQKWLFVQLGAQMESSIWSIHLQRWTKGKHLCASIFRNAQCLKKIGDGPIKVAPSLIFLKKQIKLWVPPPKLNNWSNNRYSQSQSRFPKLLCTMGMTLVILNFWWDFIRNARSINGHKFLKVWWNEQWTLCLKDMWFDQQPLSLCMPESPEGKWSEHLQKHLKTQPAHMPWSKNCLSLHSIESNTYTHT